MKQNKDREEFNQKIFGIIVDYVHDDLFKKDNCVKSIDELYDWIETHTQKKVEEKIERVKKLPCLAHPPFAGDLVQLSDVLNIMEEK